MQNQLDMFYKIHLIFIHFYIFPIFLTWKLKEEKNVSYNLALDIFSTLLFLKPADIYLRTTLGSSDGGSGQGKQD